jgi:F-type H+-transporting ATPase subunit gamma
MASLLARNGIQFKTGYGKQNLVDNRLAPNVLGPMGPLGGAQTAANLKEVRVRIKSVKSIEKITKTMKMIANSRLKAAQTRMEKNRAFYEGSTRIFDLLPVDTTKKNLIIPVTADRGLCGAINSSIAKLTRSTIKQRLSAGTQDYRLVSMGTKAHGLFARDQGSRVAFSILDLGKNPLTIVGTESIVDRITQEETFDSVTVIYNKFVSAISYVQETKNIPSPNQMLAMPDLFDYEFEDDARIFQVQDLFEFGLASTLYHAYCESAAAELSARMSAMDSASRNASEMLKALNITYNRQRQAAITTELTEIISGAAAIAD